MNNQCAIRIGSQQFLSPPLAWRTRLVTVSLGILTEGALLSLLLSPWSPYSLDASQWSIMIHL